MRDLIEQKGNEIYTENNQKISGGEKQKISMARILLLQKKFLLLDEATSAVDHDSTVNIEKYLLSDPDLTLLYVTHKVNDETKDMFDHVIELKNC